MKQSILPFIKLVDFLLTIMHFRLSLFCSSSLERTKLSQVAKCVFLGYSDKYKRFLCYDPEAPRLVKLVSPVMLYWLNISPIIFLNWFSSLGCFLSIFDSQSSHLLLLLLLITHHHQILSVKLYFS